MAKKCEDPGIFLILDLNWSCKSFRASKTIFETSSQYWSRTSMGTIFELKIEIFLRLAT